MPQLSSTLVKAKLQPNNVNVNMSIPNSSYQLDWRDQVRDKLCQLITSLTTPTDWLVLNLPFRLLRLCIAKDRHSNTWAQVPLRRQILTFWLEWQTDEIFEIEYVSKTFLIQNCEPCQRNWWLNQLIAKRRGKFRVRMFGKLQISDV